VTSVARTLCDLTAVVPDWTVERAVDDALRQKIVTLSRLAAVADDLHGPGRRRCTVMREILVARASGYHPGESEPEKRIADLLERTIGARPIPQHRIAVGRSTFRVDLAYPSESIAIEYDSDAFHLTKSAHDADARRRNRLRLAGWTVLEFTSGSSNAEIVETVDAARARATAS
jgi:very-short-patch-repair endonuclease